MYLANGNLAVVNETLPDKEGFFAIQGTEKEIALPEFYIVIVHQCSRTRVSAAVEERD